MGYVFCQIFHDFTIITTLTKENYGFFALCEKIISSVLIVCWVPVASALTALCFDLIRETNVRIVSKLQLPICLSAHPCARSFVRLSIEPITIIPAESGFRPFTYRLARAVDLFFCQQATDRTPESRDDCGQPAQSQNQGIRQKLKRKWRQFELRVEGCPGSHRLCFS